jgi:limonene-1,2-epoxide hydrolase
MSTPSETVAAYQKALAAGDFASARAGLADDLRFTGPFESLDGADAYLDTVRGLWTIVKAVEVRHVSSAGDEVVVLYEMVTNTPAGTQLICEWYGVDDDRIAWIRALFDSAPFAFLRQGK